MNAASARDGSRPPVRCWAGATDDCVGLHLLPCSHRVVLKAMVDDRKNSENKTPGLQQRRLSCVSSLEGPQQWIPGVVSRFGCNGRAGGPTTL